MNLLLIFHINYFFSFLYYWDLSHYLRNLYWNLNWYLLNYSLLLIWNYMGVYRLHMLVNLMNVDRFLSLNWVCNIYCVRARLVFSCLSHDIMVRGWKILYSLWRICNYLTNLRLIHYVWLWKYLTFNYLSLLIIFYGDVLWLLNVNNILVLMLISVISRNWSVVYSLVVVIISYIFILILMLVNSLVFCHFFIFS